MIAMAIQNVKNPREKMYSEKKSGNGINWKKGRRQREWCECRAEGDERR